MKATVFAYISSVAIAVAFFICITTAHAEEIIYQQPLRTQNIASSSISVLYVLPSGLDGFLTEIQAWVRNSTALNGNATVGCYQDALGTIACPASEPLGTGRQVTLSGSQVPLVTTAGGASLVLDFEAATTSAALELQSNRYYRINISNGGTGVIEVYGITSPNQCTQNCTGSPYTYVFGVETQPPQFDTSSRILRQVTPTNGATAPTTQVTFQFSWYNSGFELYSVAQTEISDVTSGFQYVPQQSNAAISGFGTTTQIYTLQPNHLHLWRGCLLNPTTQQKVCSGYFSLNVVGASASSSIPVIPDVNDANASSTIQSSIWAFLSVPSLLQSKLPFAYFFQVADLLNELQSTSTAAVDPVVFDYADIPGLSTTSKNALPASWTAFSTSTVTQYIPPLVLATWRILMSSVLWFGFAMYMYYAIGKLFSGTTNAV